MLRTWSGDGGFPLLIIPGTGLVGNYVSCFIKCEGPVAEGACSSGSLSQDGAEFRMSPTSLKNEPRHGWGWAGALFHPQSSLWGLNDEVPGAWSRCVL